MSKIYIPSSNYQIRQFKLYTDNFIRELESESEEMLRCLNINTMDLLKNTGDEKENPFDFMLRKLDNLSEMANDYAAKDKMNLSQIKMHKVKVAHSIDVAYDSKRVGLDLSLFNEENIKILWSSGLLHDIGRFMQLKLTGTFRDFDSFKGNFGNLTNHGQLGESILINDGRMKLFYPFTRIYDDFIGKVVGNHFESQLPDYKIVPNYKIYRNYGLSELIKDMKNGSFGALEEYDRLSSWYVKIIQDVDRLDTLKQVERGDFNPILSNDKVDDVNPVIYDIFYNGNYINMSDLKQKGLWTCNAGQLVRWSFLYQLSLVSTVKNIKDLGLIEKVWERNPIDNLKPGYDFTLALMDALIETSPDGVYIDKGKALSKVKGTYL